MIDYIAQITNQKKIASYITCDVKKPSNYIIQSLNGSGKSTLCDYVAQAWREKSNNRIAVILRSESLYSPSDYEPFFNAISKYGNEKQETIMRFFSRGAKDIPIVGNTIGAIFSILYEQENMDIKMLTDQERSIVKVFDQLVGKNNALIICEDIDVWDESSLHLLNILANRKVKKQLLENSTFLLTCNKAFPYLEEFSKNCIKLSLKPVSPDNLPIVMKYFSNSFRGTPTQCQILLTISGGNLQLLKECSLLIDYLDDSDGQEKFTFFKLISRRIENEANKPEQVIQLLKLASVIGIEARKLLLRKFSEGQIDQFLRTLEESVNLNILNEDQDNVKFIQPTIHKSFYESIGVDLCDYHLKLERCINILYPSAYKIRAMNLFSGGEIDKALVLYIVYLIGFFRNHGYCLELTDFMGKLLKSHSYYRFYKQICQAYKSYFKDAYESAYILLLSMDESILEFTFEIDYLKALICTNWYYTISNFEEGILHLMKWDYPEFKENHSEMWLRTAILLIDYEYEMSMQPDGERLLIEIHRLLDQKSAIDNSFQNTKYTLFLKANVYSKIETAFYQTQKALHYFSSIKTFHIHKYYLALLNHSANEMVFGNYETAFQLAKDAISLVRNFTEISFLKKEILINNHTISGYLSNNYSIDQCIESFGDYYGLFEDHADELLINNNIVALLTLKGDYYAASALSERIYNHIIYREDIDPYYKYFIINNRMVISCLLGNIEQTEIMLKVIQNTIPLENNKYYFIARNQYMEDILKKLSSLKLESLIAPGWNDMLIEKYPKTIGVAWKFWGKIMLFSDLQTWSDCN